MKNNLIFLVYLTLSFIVFGKNSECDKKANEYFNNALALQYNAENLISKEKLYKKAIEMCPSFAEAHNNLGDVYEKQGRYEEAIKQYKKAIEIKNDFGIAYFGIGDVFFKTGRFQEAKEWYSKGLKYEPNDKLTKDNMKIINDLEMDNIIRSDTIKKIFSSNTRGVGEEVPINFGEKLIPFDFDKYEIREDAKPQLNEIGKALKELFPRTISVEGSSYKIEIAGHTDCRGTDEYNLNLSLKRAEAIVNYLVNNYGISRDYFIVKGYGERVPIYITDDCVKNSREEAGHSLNRRVEIVRIPYGMERGGTRSVRKSSSFRGESGRQIIVDNAFFCKKEGEGNIKILKEDETLRSGIDKYFIYFKPYQDCYIYIVQEDSSGKIDLLFQGRVEGGRDYWVPSFGSSFTLDNTRGEEKIYLLATSFELKSKAKETSFEGFIMDNIKSIKVRGVKIIPRKNEDTGITQDKLKANLGNLTDRLEGETAFVRILKFNHN